MVRRSNFYFALLGRLMIGIEVAVIAERPIRSAFLKYKCPISGW